MIIDSIVIHTDIRDKLEMLSDDEAGQLFKAIIAYAENGTVFSPSDNRVLGMIFLFIKDQIDRDLDKYREKCARNREIGKLGGRPRKDKGTTHKTERLAEKPNGLFENQTVLEKPYPNPKPNPKPNPNPIPNPIPNDNDSKAKRFTKPSIQDLKEYIKEKDLNVDPDAFFDYYESKGWIVGKSPMKNWKAALRNWERNEYGTRQQSGKEPPAANIAESVEPQDKGWGERF